MSHVELAEIVLDESGYTEMLRRDKSPQAQTRLENLKELVQSMGQYDTLEAYLEHVALVLDIENETDGENVQLSTLHAAKGLEFPLVFLPGWEEEVFPSKRSIDESGEKGLEEERRLAYVGITRARARVFVSFAANRRVYNQWQSSIPSRFIEELPKDAVEQEADAGLYGNTLAGSGGGSGSYDFPGFGDASRAGAGVRRPLKMVEAESWDVKPRKSKGDYQVGDRVFHDKFGYGRVEAIDDSKLEIAFDKAGRKKVLDSFVQAASETRKP